MDKDAIRGASLAGKNKEIRALLISKQGREICKFIFDKREATTREVADHFNISIQHSSTTLEKLFKQMYLRRDQHTHESGGKEYNYFQ